MSHSDRYGDVTDCHIRICKRIDFDTTEGDIATSVEDTVINSTDDDVNMEVSVSNALAKRAGASLVKACKSLVPLAAGTVAETGPYNMPCKQILHANCPYWKTTKSPDELKKIFIKCLEKCAQSGYRSLATPTIGMGAKGYPVEVVALALIEATAEYAEKYPQSSIKIVKLYLYERGMTAAQRETFRSTMLLLGSKRTANGQMLTNDAKFEVFTGDLAETKADVIVNSTGNGMSLSSGAISIALLNKAGKPLQDECKQVAPLETGEVAVTSGYALPCNNVVHTCPPSWKGEKTEKILMDMLTKALQAAEDLSAISIAFPAIGTGLLQYPPERVARIFFLACAKFASQNSQGTLKTVKVVIFTDDVTTTAGFEKMLRRTLKPYAQTQEKPESVLVGMGKLINDLPAQWVNPLYDYKESVVQKGGTEWTNCVQAFQKTLGDVSKWEVLEVKRVQNPASYQLYSSMRVGVARKLRKQEHEVERTLWHGTKQQTIPMITRNKFDRGLSGTAVGALYGWGSYFATRSEYSAMYCTANNDGDKFMIMAKVITGDYTQGSSGMKQAPYKKGSKYEQYDSVVDNVSNPSMFVVFHDASAYPGYIIKFKRTPSPQQVGGGCSVM